MTKTERWPDGQRYIYKVIGGDTNPRHLNNAHHEFNEDDNIAHEVERLTAQQGWELWRIEKVGRPVIFYRQEEKNGYPQDLVQGGSTVEILKYILRKPVDDYVVQLEKNRTDYQESLENCAEALESYRKKVEETERESQAIQLTTARDKERIEELKEQVHGLQYDKRKMENDIARLREHFGAKAFQEALKDEPDGD